MERGATGTWTHRTDAAGVAYKSFAPFPLPPVPPPATDGPWRALADEALIAVARLDSVSMLLPDASHLLYAYVRKEAVLSSQIEGTQSSLSDLLLFENDAAPGVPVEDVREVSCYVAAAEHGVKLLREGIPLSRRLLCDVHRTLMSSGRGTGKAPGEFRRSPVWLGGPRPDLAIFVHPMPPSSRITSVRLSASSMTPTFERLLWSRRRWRTRSSRPVPRRKRPPRSSPCHVRPLRGRRSGGTPPVSQPLPQAAPKRLLCGAAAHPHARRLGELAGVLLSGRARRRTRRLRRRQGARTALRRRPPTASGPWARRGLRAARP